MAGDLELALRIRADLRQAVKEVRGLRDDLRATGRGGKQAGRDMRGFGRGVDAMTRKMRQASAQTAALRRRVLGLAAAIVSISAARNFVRAFREQEQAVAKLDASIVSMGRTTDGLSRKLQQLASQVQREGVIGDEAIILGQSFLTTYGAITDELLPRTTRVMADLAAKMGGDTVQAANLLGKASLGMTGELTRVGITLSDAAKESKDFQLILRDIEAQVSGTNAALARTATGGIDQFANSWGDAKEQMGEALALASGPILRNLARDLGLSQDNVDHLAESMFNAFEAIAVGGAGLVDTLATPMALIKDQVNDLWEAFKNLPTWAQEIGIVGALMGGIKGKAILLGALKFTEGAKVTAQWFEALQSGAITFSEWLAADNEEAAARLKELREQGVLPAEEIPSVPDLMLGEAGTPESAEARVRAFFAEARKGFEELRANRGKGPTVLSPSIFTGGDAGAGDEAEAERKRKEKARKAAEVERRMLAERRRILDELDPTAPLVRELELIEKLKAKWPAYADVFDEATLRIHERMDEIVNGTQEASDEMGQFAIQAARNLQSAFADFLFDPFEDGLDGMLRGFVDVLRRMASEALAAQLAKKLFGDFDKTGELGGLVGNFLAGIFHGGGRVGEAAPTRAVSPLLFANAPRLHEGLRADEYPAILQRDEEVLAKDDPANSRNGGAGAGVRIVNVLDPSLVGDYMTSAEGERVVLNVLQKNAATMRGILA